MENVPDHPEEETGPKIIGTLIVDEEGNIVGQEGETGDLDPETIRSMLEGLQIGGAIADATGAPVVFREDGSMEPLDRSEEE